MLEPMDVEPPSDLIVPRAPPPPRNVEFAVYPPGYGPSSNARRAANAEAARQRRSDIHFERRGNYDSWCYCSIWRDSNGSRRH